MPLFPGRPSSLTQKLRAGVYQTHVNGEGGRNAFSDRVKKATAWARMDEAEEGDYCLLDTFLGDSVTARDDESILRQVAKGKKPVRILLVDSTSASPRASPLPDG